MISVEHAVPLIYCLLLSMAGNERHGSSNLTRDRDPMPQTRRSHSAAICHFRIVILISSSPWAQALQVCMPESASGGRAVPCPEASTTSKFDLAFAESSAM